MKNKFLVDPDGKPIGMPAKYVHTGSDTDSLDAVAKDAPKKEVPAFSMNSVMMWVIVAAALIATFYFVVKLHQVYPLLGIHQETKVEQHLD